MFCKPPCPDEHDLTPVSDASDNHAGPERAQRTTSQQAFGRLIAPETAGPERGLPPAPIRTG